MARKLIVEILGDSKSLERSFTRSTAAANKFGRDVDTGLGRAEARFTKLQRVAAGGFVGGIIASTGIQAIKSVVTAAAESQQVLGQTRVALEATGKSWEQYGKQIEDTVRAQSKLGFDDEALLRTFSFFQRTTGDVTSALKENQLAMDVARGRFISLEQAAALVNKANLGMAGSLRRIGIDTKGATTSTQLLALLTEKYGGAAQAASKDATTALDRVEVSTRNLKESIGTLLLPSVTTLADELAQVADAAAITVSGLHDLANVRIPAIHIPFVIDLPGGTLGDVAGFGIKTFIKVNTLGLAATVGLAIADQFKHDSQDPSVTGPLADSFRTSIGGMIDTSLGAAAPKVTVTPAKVKGFGTGLKPSDLFGPKITGIPKAAQEALLDAELSGKGIRDTLVKQRNILANALDDPRNNRNDRIKIKTALKGVKDQIAAIDADVAAGIKQSADDRKARLDKLEQAAKDAREKHKAKLKKIAEHQAQLARDAREALKARVQARQFRAIGLGGEGDAIIPTVANLRKQFAQLGDNIEPGQLSSKLRKQFAGVGRLLRGDLGKVTSATRDAINQLFRTIRDTFQNQDDVFTVSPATTALNKNKIVQGLGLDRHTEQLIKSRLSGFNAAGRALNPARGTTGAFGITLPPIHVNTTVNLDGQKVAQNTSIHQGKNRRSNPRQKRGPWSGGGWS